MSFSSTPKASSAATALSSTTALFSATSYVIGRQLILAVQPDSDDDKSFQPMNSSDFIAIMSSKVIKAELWIRPLENIASVLAILGLAHHGVVVTLDDGARYLIHKFAADDAGVVSSSSNAQDGHDENIKVNDNKGKAIVAVATATAMGKKWSRVREKVIRNSTVTKFVEVCDQEYRLSSNNCIHAADRMMNLE